MCRYATAARCVAGGVRSGESLRNANLGRVRRRLTGRGESWSRQRAAWRSRDAGERVCRRCAAAAYCWRLRTPAQPRRPRSPAPGHMRIDNARANHCIAPGSLPCLARLPRALAGRRRRRCTSSMGTYTLPTETFTFLALLISSSRNYVRFLLFIEEVLISYIESKCS